MRSHQEQGSVPSYPCNPWFSAPATASATSEREGEAPAEPRRRRAVVCLFAVGVAIALGAGAPTSEAGEISGRVSDPGGTGISDAVVFIETMPDGAANVGKPTAVMDQVQKEFVPHLLPVVVGTEVSFPNHDQIHHHVYSFSRTKTFEIPLYKGEETAPVLFDKVGAVKVGCNIHDWMSGVILVVPTNYFAVTAADGSFTIVAVPPGTYTLTVWHEGAKTKAEETAKTVQVGDGTSEALFTLEVTPPPARAPVRGLRGYE